MIKKADVLIFPILFSVNHAIELYEKIYLLEFEYIVRPAIYFQKKFTISVAYGMTRKMKIQEFGFGYGHEEVEFNKMIKNFRSISR